MPAGRSGAATTTLKSGFSKAGALGLPRGGGGAPPSARAPKCAAAAPKAAGGGTSLFSMLKRTESGKAPEGAGGAFSALLGIKSSFRKR